MAHNYSNPSGILDSMVNIGANTGKLTAKEKSGKTTSLVSLNLTKS